MYLIDALPRSEIIRRMDGILSPHSVRKYVSDAVIHARKNGISIKERQKVEKAPADFATRKALGPLHVRVGAKLNRFRLGLDPDMEPRRFAQTFRIGNQRSVREMELGLYDFTLSELNAIAAAMNTDVLTLLQQPGSNGSH